MFSSRHWFETMFSKGWPSRMRFVTLNRQERAPQKYQPRWERTSLSFNYNLFSGDILTFSSPSIVFTFFSLGLLLLLFLCRFFFPLTFLVCHPCLVSVFPSLSVFSSHHVDPSLCFSLILLLSQFLLSCSCFHSFLLSHSPSATLCLCLCILSFRHSIFSHCCFHL